MKKSLLLGLTTFAALGLSAQNYKFKPTWKVGDQKNYTSTVSSVEYTNGEETESSEVNSEILVKVLSETASDYKLEITYKQPQTAQQYRELEMEEEAKKAESSSYIYNVDKATGKAKLQEEPKAKKDEDEEGLEALMGIMGKNQEAENAKVFGFLFTAFGQEFPIEDTLKITESEPNPFSPGSNIDCTTNYWLSNPTGKSCDINTSIDYDLSAFKDMMKQMMTKMADALGADEKDKKKIEKESKAFDEFDISMANFQTVTYDMTSSWPSKTVMNVEIKGNEKGKKHLSKISNTIVLKP